MKYRKTALIEATRWFKNGDHPNDYAEKELGFENGQLRTFFGDERKANGWEGGVVRYYRHPEVPGEKRCDCGAIMHVHGWIDTLEGGHIVCPGDWIATGVEGEHWPIKHRVFVATYEEVSHDGPPHPLR